MSIYNFRGYLAKPGLGGELIGFNARTGQPVQAAAGSLGSYSDLSTDFYKTFQHENWQHPGSSGWSSANVPGWGNNPMLQMGPRRAVGELPKTAGLGLFLAIGLVGYLALSGMSEPKYRAYKPRR